MILYGLKTCDTCRKAVKALPDAEYVDVRKDGVAPEVLERAYGRFGEKLVNKSSTTWRQLDEDQRARPALDLIAEHPTLMKRPLIEEGDKMWLGWGKDVQAELAG